MRIVGYYASWSIYARGYAVSQIPAEKLTHLNYAFAALNDQGECASGDPRADETNLAELRQLKADHPHLRTLISVGGRGTAQAFSRAAAGEEERRRFAVTCVAFMQQHGFDGIDVDWEYPQPAESSNYLALLAELRAQLQAAGAGGRADREGEAYLLTVAYGASPYQYDDIDLAQAASLVDWMNVMAYDFHGAGSALTGFNAPLFASSHDQAASSVERETFNLHAAVQAYLERGVPAGKIVPGVPFYGNGWGGVPPENNGLYQPFDPDPGETRSYDYREIAADYLVQGSPFTRYWDEQARVPWLYSPERGLMVSYEDAQSLREKAGYIRARGLGGVMVWHLAADDAAGTLLAALVEALQ